MIGYVSVFMIFAGLALLILFSSQTLRARFGFDRSVLNIHIGGDSVFSRFLLEFLIALVLIVFSVALYIQVKWGLMAALLSLLGLIYISLKRWNWSFAENAPHASVYPPILGFIGGSISIIMLIIQYR
ncbi:MAG: hypothetical protein H6540_00025 [Bacteroidales bacterium]|nr:hypothetical protein [Bacteroidales bacterium]MCB9012885.1 hypothetical protein [Bacteroidales bacterium]